LTAKVGGEVEFPMEAILKPDSGQNLPVLAGLVGCTSNQFRKSTRTMIF
jgi:hypothetical protein